ncbi:MAG: DEAD/DEAH box helicase [Planctomycetota bacterium]
MSVAAFLAETLADPDLARRVVHRHVDPAIRARTAEPASPLVGEQRALLAGRGIERLYSHQARALDLARDGRDVLLTSGPASGKSLGFLLPLVEALGANPDARALLLYPAKALAQDQFRAFERDCRVIGGTAGLDRVLAGVIDGDTPSSTRRRLRDRGAVLFSNPDFVHAAVLPHHARWAGFLARLELLVVDELHVCSGLFGANAGMLFRRLLRVARHYGAAPRIVAGSATVGNPGEHAADLFGRELTVVTDDGSPRGRRTTLFWNPPRVRSTRRRSRRSANVEATDLMVDLVTRGIPTITFSKARVTSELIHRYARAALAERAPGLGGRVSPYRGGLLPEERRRIERRLFDGDLLGVSTTRALELGIDVGGLDASVIVGWPGTVAGFRQQAGRAGRRGRDSLVVLVGLDTPTNQFVLRHPEYVFDRPVEAATAEPHDPFVLSGQLRCAAQELPVTDGEDFGPFAPVVLEVLSEHAKLHRLDGRWYHAAAEVPQHEVSLRDATDRNFLVTDIETGRALGEVGKWDGQSVLHPEAIYLHLGETWRVERLDLEKSIAFARRVEVDYYTQSLGGDDVHHVDRVLRERPFGAGRAYFGEVTVYFRVYAYERVRFYGLDTVSRHGVSLPTWPVETTAFWIEPPEDVLEDVKGAGLDPMAGLRGIGFATRTILPFFVSGDVLDLSHTIGGANAPWSTIFVWEHYPRGLGYAAKGYERLGEIVPAVREAIATCPCRRGCPNCTGKPLHPYTVLNPERGEGSLPDKRAALAILDGLIDDGLSGNGMGLDEPDERTLLDSPAAMRERLSAALRRRLQHQREPEAFHPVVPVPPREVPAPESTDQLRVPDAACRGERRRALTRRIRQLGVSRERDVT